MPRTKSSKEDTRTPLEKLEAIQTKIDLLIFFNYYDGFITDGNVGFDIKIGKPGSAKHRKTDLLRTLTVGQFSSKGKKYAQLANAFIVQNEIPPPEMRPHITVEDITQIESANATKRAAKGTPEERLAKVVDEKEIFMFQQYYQGYLTNWETGFNLRTAHPGSVVHKRVYANYFSTMNESHFRNKGKYLAELAKEFAEAGIQPDTVPIVPPRVPLVRPET